MKRFPILLCGLAVCVAAASGVPAPVGAGGDQSPRDAKVRVFLRQPSDRATAARYGATVEDYGSFLVARMSAAQSRAATGAGLDVEPLDQRIGIGNYRFDPAVSVPTVPRELADTTGDDAARPWIVQFHGPARPEWIARANDAGAEVLQYVPENAFLVRATPSAVERVRAAREVRWVGAYEPAYKLSGDLAWLAGFEAPRTQADRQRYWVGVFHGVDLGSVESAIRVMGGEVLEQQDLRLSYFTLLTIDLDTGRLAQLAAMREICRIETWAPKELDDERSNQVLAGNFTGTTVPAAGYASFLTARGVNGLNVTVGIVDDGVAEGSTDAHLTGRVTSVLRGASAGASGHGHHDAGIVAGQCAHAVDSGGFLWSGGMAPQSCILNIPLLRSGYTGSDSQAQADVVETAGTNGVAGSISSNSWGNGSSGQYGSYEAMFDDIVRDASTQSGIQPLLLVFSAGNNGPGASTLTRPKTAKNVLTVGASENYRPTQTGSTGCGSVTADNIDEMACFSSRGPAGDGRFKPDVVAPGTWIASARSGPDALWGNIDANHRYSTGTSQACPHVSGAAALLTEWWKSTHGGVNPSPALLKAMIVSGALDLAATSPTVPNNTEGWGRVDLTNVLNSTVATIHNDQADVLTNVGGQSVVTGTVPDSTKPFRVTLVWTDPAGAAGANPARVNDLDLTVTVGGQTYRGNVFLNGTSTTGGSADTLNNVENVFLPAGVSGPFTVTVTATQLNGDGALGTGDTSDQHFGLVVSNGASAAAGGTDTIGAYAPATGIFFLRNTNDAGVADLQFVYGQANAGWLPITGDWDGDGDDTVGVYDPVAGVFHLRNSNTAGPADLQFAYGAPGAGWLPIAGDWDGDGDDTIGLYDPTTSIFYLRNANNAGVADLQYIYGPGGLGWRPLAGDFDSNNTDTVALHDPSTGVFYLRNAHASGPADLQFVYGPVSATAFTGDWDGNGSDTAGVYTPASGVYFLRNSNTAGVADLAFPYGAPGLTPLRGDWNGL